MFQLAKISSELTPIWLDSSGELTGRFLVKLYTKLTWSFKSKFYTFLVVSWRFYSYWIKLHSILVKHDSKTLSCWLGNFDSNLQKIVKKVFNLKFRLWVKVDSKTSSQLRVKVNSISSSWLNLSRFAWNLWDCS